eukprot:469359-Rhodomonas_salina.3
MSGTGIAHGAISLRHCYAMSVLTYRMLLRAPYAMSDPDLAYVATSFELLNPLTAQPVHPYVPTCSLRNVRY